ncbi:unnamed protein product [Polarella glacialis]|uniref:Uncharacterized protein n=1 Tax=Polarella glacialis TaxID=89957 RepID=A0A813G095_POLGL|nr:unnamed protein product [Polarella glacialis]
MAGPQPGPASSTELREAAAVRQAWGGCTIGGGDVLELSHLCHAIVAPGVEEKIRIRLFDIELPSHNHVDWDLRCKAYVGGQAAVAEGPEGRSDKSRLREIKLEQHGSSWSSEIDVGIPDPQAPWAIRLKLYHRPASALFAQEKLAEVTGALPRPAGRVALAPASPGQPPGSARLEVLRLVPASALEALKEAVGEVLVQAIKAGVDAEDIQELCVILVVLVVV